jgi:hypothetical protein
VRVLWHEVAKLRAAGGGEDAVVRRLREGARGAVDVIKKKKNVAI